MSLSVRNVRVSKSLAQDVGIASIGKAPGSMTTKEFWGTGYIVPEGPPWAYMKSAEREVSYAT